MPERKRSNWANAESGSGVAASAAKITKKSGGSVLTISGAAGTGITELLRRAFDIILEERAAAESRDVLAEDTSEVHALS